MTAEERLLAAEDAVSDVLHDAWNSAAPPGNDEIDRLLARLRLRFAGLLAVMEAARPLAIHFVDDEGLWDCPALGSEPRACTCGAQALIDALAALDGTA